MSGYKEGRAEILLLAMIKGLFFDLGGTLYSYRNMGDLTCSVLEEFVARHELELDSIRLFEHYQAASRQADQHFAYREFYLVRDYLKQVFFDMVELAELSDTAHDCEWFATRHLDILAAGMVIKDDCYDMLDELRSRGLYLSIVSNNDENLLRRQVDSGQLDKWFDHWLSSEAAKSCKPHPRVFELALEKSALAPEEVLFVGDSLEQDVKGAHAAGMHTVLISEDGSHAPMHVGMETVDPDYRITNLSELPGIVTALNARV